MLSKRALFLKHIAQTSAYPAIVEVAHAKGVFIYDQNRKRYFDLASGIGPSILGHGHPVVLDAIMAQSAQYLHTMVYGEHVQSPQVDYAQALLGELPPELEQIYFLSSGSEAIEAALKIARLSTGRTTIISAKNSYHGSTIGAESLRSDVPFVKHISPVVPGVKHLRFDVLEDLSMIDENVAAVIMETIQAENGVILPSEDYMKALRQRCDEQGTLLILDEIQVGLGRTGSLFAFQAYGIVPDLLVLGKALGGGLPLSAVVSGKEVMSTLSLQVPLAHLTTFGGHPLCCAAGLATFRYIVDQQLAHRARLIGQRFEENLSESGHWTIRRAGAMVAFNMNSEESAVGFHTRLHEAGIISDLLLFDTYSWRIAPPLIITDQEIDEACDIVRSLLS